MVTIQKNHRLMIIIAIYFSFFVAEVSIGSCTQSLALIADAFHCLNDLMGFIVALVALHVSDRHDIPHQLSFGWHRAQILGAFFNGVFLLALGLSTFLQSVERFVYLRQMKNPRLITVVGCLGLTVNLLSILILHEHNHDHMSPHVAREIRLTQDKLSLNQSTSSPHPHINDDFYARPQSTSPRKHPHLQDLGIKGVMIHLIGDVCNNIGVIIAGIVIWKGDLAARFYADPIVSMAIAIVIMSTAFPLCKSAGSILMESVPMGVQLKDILHDLEQIPDVLAIHDLHAWGLNQQNALASARVLTTNDSLQSFMQSAKLINECLLGYGIQSSTLQPELVTTPQQIDTTRISHEVITPFKSGIIVSTEIPSDQERRT